MEAPWRLTADLRAMPDFVILGAMKAGTTAMFRFIGGLPGVLPARVKEVQYFSYHYDKGERWYRMHFPMRWHLECRSSITGEASPAYLFHPEAPQRCAQTVPNARLIAVLRNPIDRAYSHYVYERARGMEPLSSFSAAIEAEERRMVAPTAEESGLGRAPWRIFSYKARGRYAEQLERWYAAFDRDRLLIVQGEHLLTHPATVVAHVAGWLGVRHREPVGGYQLHNVGTYESEIDPATREALAAYFVPHNERLYTLLGYRFDWD